jgi:hypothetical protein
LLAVIAILSLRHFKVNLRIVFGLIQKNHFFSFLLIIVCLAYNKKICMSSIQT